MYYNPNRPVWVNRLIPIAGLAGGLAIISLFHLGAKPATDNPSSSSTQAELVRSALTEEDISPITNMVLGADSTVTFNTIVNGQPETCQATYNPNSDHSATSIGRITCKLDVLD